MKKLIALLLITLHFSFLKAQVFYWVSTPTVLAQNAADVKIVTKVSFGNSAMPINHSASVDNVNKKVNLVSCYLYNPVAPSAPIFIDTINVGAISLGNYDLNYTVFISSQMTVCAPYDTTANSYPFSAWESTGTQELNASQLIQISPNPASTEFYIDLKNNSADPTTLSITNCLGQEIYVQAGLTENRAIVDCANWPPGLYLISTKSKNVNSRKKLIVN